MDYELGFIGAGNMAEAIARGAIQRGVMPVTKIAAADPAMPRRAVFQQLGVMTSANPADIATRCKHLLLAVKPQALPNLAELLGSLDAGNQIVMSIMAGVSSAKIESHLGGTGRVVRIMPNTPLMVGRGMTAIALGDNARDGDDGLAMKLFGACGEAIRVEEKLIDAVTAVSGSGPAYLFYLAEAMQTAAQELGLGDHARLLVNQTLLGSAELLTQSDDTPEELRRKVTSPGGTTEAAVNHLEQNAVKDTVVAALRAARDRGIELGG